MPATSIPITEEARLLDIPEEEVEKLAGPGGPSLARDGQEPGRRGTSDADGAHREGAGVELLRGLAPQEGAAGSDTEPLSLKELRTEQLTPQLAGAAMKDGAKPGRMLGAHVPEAGPAGFKFQPGSWNAAVLQG
jgi:hypothetical protein